MLRIVIFLAASALLVAGCAPTPPLQSKSAANPGSVDLSGDWILRGADNMRPRNVEDGAQPFRIPRRGSQGRSQRQDADERTAVSVFVENGRALRITQTDHGLFISFDRAVVEEYTFGENRIVSVGPIEAQRVSGWEGRSFVVETMDSDGARLRESWTLTNDSATLVRRIAVSKRDTEEFALEQVFDRS